jgi:hypothetical protein
MDVRRMLADSTPASTVDAPGVAMNRTAKTLLDRLTRMEISAEEFFQLANKLPDRELELLFELLRQREMKVRRGEETG